MDFLSPSYSLGTPVSSSACSPQNLRFYTAPSSPIQLQAGRNLNSYDSVGCKPNDDEFEFEITSRIFANQCEFQQTHPAFWWMKRNDNEEQKYRLPARAKSFCSGQILPLKPPPGLQTSVSSSPRSPNSLLRIPFARPCTWNDDFDPFQFALEKVSEETRARGSFHRRSHSYSGYRTSAVAHWLDGPMGHNKDQYKQPSKPNNIVGPHIKPNEHLKPRGPTLANMMDHKESIYSRLVQTIEPRSKSSVMVRTKSKGVWLGRKVKDGDHEPMKAQSESSMHRVISFLFKYASSKKGGNDSKKSWKLRRCLGYTPGSPPFMK